MWTLWWPKFNWWSNLFIFEVFYSDPVSGRKVWRQFWSSPSFLSSSGQVKATFFFSGDFQHVWNKSGWGLNELLTCFCPVHPALALCYGSGSLLWLSLLWLRLRGLIHFQTKLYPNARVPFSLLTLLCVEGSSYFPKLFILNVSLN